MYVGVIRRVVSDKMDKTSIPHVCGGDPGTRRLRL